MQRRIYRIFVFCLFGVFFAFENAFSNGYTLLDIGGNFATPVDAGPTAVFWNPSALSFYDGFEIMFDIGGFYSWTGYKKEGTDEQVTSRGFFPVPFFGLTYSRRLPLRFLTRLTAGFASYIPFGVDADFPADGPQRFHIDDGSTALINLSPALSFTMFDRLSIGVAVNFGIGLMSASGSDFMLIEGYESPENEVRYRMDNLIGNGVSVSAGVLIKALSSLWLGFSYTSPVEVKHNGSIIIRPVPESKDTFYSITNAESVEGDIEASIKYPQYINAGVKWSPLSSWEFVLLFQWFNWDAYKELPVYIKNTHDPETGNSVSLDPLNPSSTEYRDRFVTGFQDSLTFRLDARYKYRRHTFGIGFEYDGSGIPDIHLSPMNLEFEKLEIILAYRWKVARSVELSLGFNHYIPFRREIRNSRLTPPANGLYRASGERVNLSVNFYL